MKLDSAARRACAGYPLGHRDPRHPRVLLVHRQGGQVRLAHVPVGAQRAARARGTDNRVKRAENRSKGTDKFGKATGNRGKGYR